MANESDSRKQKLADLKAENDRRRQEAGGVAVAEEPAGASGADIMSALKDRAAANGFNIQTEPPAPPAPPPPPRSPLQKALGSPNPEGFNRQFMADQEKAKKDRAANDEVESWDASQAEWERNEQKRQEAMKAEMAAGRPVDLADPRWRATPMPRPPRRIFESGKQLGPDGQPVKPGATDVPMARKGSSNVGMVAEMGELVPGSDEANYQTAMEELDSATIGGKRVKPIEDKKNPHAQWEWSKAGAKSASKGARGEKAQEKPAQKQRGGDRRPMSDVGRQVEDAKARGAEVQNRIDNNLGLSGTEQQAAMFGPDSLRPAKPSRSAAPIRLPQQPSALGAGDEIPDDELTPEQLAVRSDRNHIAAPMGAANGGSKWGRRAVSDADWKSIHSVDPVTRAKVAKFGALPEYGVNFDKEGAATPTNAAILGRVADMLGISREVPEGERLAEANLFYQEQLRMRKSHDVVDLPTGGSMFTPNAGMKAGIEQRKGLKDINDFSKAHPYHNSPYDPGTPKIDHIRQLRDAVRSGDMDTVASLKAEVRADNADARNRAYKDQLRQRGATQNMRNPALAPAMYQDSVRQAYQSGDPMDVAMVREQYGNPAGAQRAREERLIEGQTDAERDVGLASADAARAVGDAKADAERQKNKTPAELANESINNFMRTVLQEDYSMSATATMNNFHRLNIQATAEGKDSPAPDDSERQFARMLLENPTVVQQMAQEQRGDLLSIVKNVAAKAAGTSQMPENWTMRSPDEDGFLASKKSMINDFLAKTLGIDDKHPLYNVILTHVLESRKQPGKS